MRNIIQDRGWWRGTEAEIGLEMERRHRAELEWDECQNVASPDERNKGSGRNRITLGPVAPAFRFLYRICSQILSDVSADGQHLSNCARPLGLEGALGPIQSPDSKDSSFSSPRRSNRHRLNKTFDSRQVSMLHTLLTLVNVSSRVLFKSK